MKQFSSRVSSIPYLLKSQIIETFRDVRKWSRALSKKQIVLIVSVLVVVPATVLFALFLTPRTVSFAFAGDNCFFNPALLPNTLQRTSDSNFTSRQEPSISIGSYPLFSTTTCVEMTGTPDEETSHSVELTTLGIFNKDITITVESYPELEAMTRIAEPVSPNGGLIFSLKQQDNTFDYALEVENQITECMNDSIFVQCELTNMQLEQGAEYAFTLERSFEDDRRQVMSDNITLRDPVTITGSSITEGALVFDTPQSFTLTTNKPVRNVSDVSLKAGETELAVEASASDTEIVIATPEPLPREVAITLQINGIMAEDGAFLPQPYVLTFQTSGGPKVQGINVESYKVSVSRNISLTFDTEINTEQTLSDFVSISSASGAVPSSYSVDGRTVTISPNSNLPRCTDISISVRDGISNFAGVSGNSAWSTSFRTICQKAYSIGSSVQGRSITAYEFGGGSQTIIFVGGMHGDEKSSVYTMNTLTDHLERNYSTIPADKTIIVIPNHNPDGFVADTRTNANNVDLNRNFPANNWASGVYLPGNLFLPQGGGTAALSEPESSALASFVLSRSPRLVLTYHAVASVVIGNGAGDANSLASTYGSLSGFAAYTSAQEDAIFGYATTGEFEDWLHDKHGIPTLLVELSTNSGNEFNRQFDAIWAMINI